MMKKDQEELALMYLQYVVCTEYVQQTHAHTHTLFPPFSRHVVHTTYLLTIYLSGFNSAYLHTYIPVQYIRYGRIESVGTSE